MPRSPGRHSYDRWVAYSAVASTEDHWLLTVVDEFKMSVVAAMFSEHEFPVLRDTQSGGRPSLNSRFYNLDIVMGSDDPPIWQPCTALVRAIDTSCLPHLKTTNVLINLLFLQEHLIIITENLFYCYITNILRYMSSNLPTYART